jgi:[ribosomal protein S18]-alanine N-acetyltransferase
MIIRPMKEEDLPSVLDIEAVSFSDPWKKRHFLYELNENPYAFLFVAVEKEIIVGFINFWITFEQAMINQIAVLPALKRKGIASTLINDAFNRMKLANVISVSLEVRKTNKEAIAFYQRHGFNDILIKPQYYQDGTDAIYMIKEMKNE